MLVITKVGAHLTARASHHHVHLPHEAIPELILCFVDASVAGFHSVLVRIL